MATIATVTVSRSTLRNPYAQHAAARSAGAMKHRAAPRGGNRNAFRDLLDEWQSEQEDTYGTV